MDSIRPWGLQRLAHSSALKASFRAIRLALERHPDSDLLAATARGLMIGYDARWARSGWSPMVVQPAFHLPIVNPATGYRSRTFSLAGRCDGVVVWRRQRFLLESKTVGESLEPIEATFWARMAVDTQSGLYALARRQQGDPVAGVLYDVLRRPQVRPRLIPKGTPGRADGENAGTRLELQGRKTYFGWPIDERESEAVFGGDARETPELYSLRLAADTLRRPARYFQRKVVKPTKTQSARHAHELWQTAVEIRLAQRAGRHYGNSTACMAYHRACPYLSLCAGWDAPDSDRWPKARSIHPELIGVLEGVAQRHVLTFSRIQCFKLCRRKHYWRYELGILPADARKADALRFGRVIHQALAAWWGNLGDEAKGASDG